MTPPPTLPDPRNAGILVWVGQELLPRDQAKVSVFDSSVQGGDAVWEGLRLYEGGIFRLTAHLDRLEASARALAFEGVPDPKTIVQAITRTLEANRMRDGVHIRLTLTRGLKVTSGMNPRLNQSGTCLLVLAEFKPPVYDTAGIRLMTSSIRRNAPQCLPSTIHHNNLLNNILAKIQANAAGADDAIMLDVNGYVAETNATNLFLVRDGGLQTPTALHCLPGITRRAVLEMARRRGVGTIEGQIRLEEFYRADEVFCTGTMGELVSVLKIDDRTIGTGAAGPLTLRLQEWFKELVRQEREMVV